MKCIGCEKFSFGKVGKDADKPAKQGLGRCALDKRNYYHYSAMFERDCPKFEERDAALTAKFITWLSKQ